MALMSHRVPTTQTERLMARDRAQRTLRAVTVATAATGIAVAGGGTLLAASAPPPHHTVTVAAVPPAPRTIATHAARDLPQRGEDRGRAPRHERARRHRPAAARAAAVAPAAAPPTAPVQTVSGGS